MKFFLLFCCCFITSDLLAQSPKAIEDELRKSFGKVGYWEEHQYDTTSNLNGEDSLLHANKVFQSKLKRYTIKYPFTLNQKFSSIDGLLITTSTDGMLRTYSWDDGTGGTMRYYKSVIQFKNGGKLYSFIEKESPIYTEIYSLKTAKGTYYLVGYFARAMSSYFVSGVEGWSISNGKLNKKADLFMTSSGLKNSIDYAYWMDDNLKGDLKYVEKSKALYIPLTTEKERLTGKYIAYKFTGQYFERVKN